MRVKFQTFGFRVRDGGSTRDPVKKKSSSFEALLGQSAYFSTTIRNAIDRSIAVLPAIPGRELAEYVSQCDTAMLPVLKKQLALLEPVKGILRKYAERPPEATPTDLPKVFGGFSAKEQKTLTALIFDGLLRWVLFDDIDAVPLLGERVTLFQKEYQVGKQAYEGLRAFEAQLKSEEEKAEIGEFAMRDFAHSFLSAAKITVPSVADYLKSIYDSGRPDGSPLYSAASNFLNVAQRGLAMIDTGLLQSNSVRGEFDYWTFQHVASPLGSGNPDHGRLVWQAVLAGATKFASWQPPDVPPRRNLKPVSKDPTLLRCTRVLELVHELHKAGYQRIRISPGMSRGQRIWRCPITYDENIEDDGFTIRDFGSSTGHVASFTSGDRGDFFGIKGSAHLGAKYLAEKFLNSYPTIALKGAGRDWMYAGWLTDVLGRAEQGGDQDLVVLYPGNALEQGELMLWQPPPPLARNSK